MWLSTTTSRMPVSNLMKVMRCECRIAGAARETHLRNHWRVRCVSLGRGQLCPPITLQHHHTITHHNHPFLTLIPSIPMSAYLTPHYIIRTDRAFTPTNYLTDRYGG
ncbi:uncharacterized protein LOC143915726 [Arctopsyche grandis]|uniref:uncharacterized protein LOC143915726 n=1 Tax=Arctopsyche grandis TaxID=121162 RepID=UPI00406D9F01